MDARQYKKARGRAWRRIRRQRGESRRAFSRVLGRSLWFVWRLERGSAGRLEEFLLLPRAGKSRLAYDAIVELELKEMGI